MGHPPRLDSAGRWFHVMNRGIGRRMAFRGRTDIRYFLSRVARAVRRGDLEIHAYCVMSTHFHLLVRSPVGRLSEALRRVQNEYVRYFNRANRRDGPLFRGRFRSRPVHSLEYWRLLFGYIDHNPVTARLVGVPHEYPWGSAARLATRPPRWLATWWAEEVVASARHTDPQATYSNVLGRVPTSAQRILVEMRAASRPAHEDDLDDLLAAAPERVLAWLRRKAALADGTPPGLPAADPANVRTVLCAARLQLGPWLHQARRGRPVDLWAVAEAVLYRELVGLSNAASALHLDVTPAQVGKRLGIHRRLTGDAGYLGRLAELAGACIQAAHGTQR